MVMACDYISRFNSNATNLKVYSHDRRDWLVAAMASLLVMPALVSGPESLAEHSRMRAAMAALVKWILLASLGQARIGGLVAMAITSVCRNSGWAWAKLATGILTFEWTLVSVQGPMQKQAELSTQALAGQFGPGLIEKVVHAERLAMGATRGRHVERSAGGLAAAVRWAHRDCGWRKIGNRGQAIPGAGLRVQRSPPHRVRLTAAVSTGL